MPGCRPGVVAAGPRDCRITNVKNEGGSRGTRTHNPLRADTCFRDRPLIRPDDFRTNLPAPSCGSWNRTSGLLSQSQASLPAATVPQSRSAKDGPRFGEVRGEGFRTFIACFKDRQPTISRSPSVPDDLFVSSALRESNPPFRLGRPGPLPLGQGHALFRSSCGGRNRTCVSTVNNRLPVPAQAPPHQSADDPQVRQTVLKSTQWELNPHVRPGEAAGSPYIMGALTAYRVVKDQFAFNTDCAVTRNGASVKTTFSSRHIVLVAQEHRVRLELTLPHYGCGVLAAERPVLFVGFKQWDQRDLNPHRPG